MGAYGTVHEACLADGCSYAVKFQRYRSERERARILGEVSTQRVLWEQHAVGPRYVGSWQCAEQRVVAIVTELWAGGSLDECEYVPPRVVDRLEAQVRSMHRAGYLHNDMFPRNVLVRRDGYGHIDDATITDFGLASKMPVQGDDDEWALARARRAIEQITARDPDDATRYYSPCMVAGLISLAGNVTTRQLEDEATGALFARNPWLLDFVLVQSLRILGQ